MKAQKVFYTVPELARLLGISRWTMRRWLDAKGIPYETRIGPGKRRSGRILVLVADLRMNAPGYAASLAGAAGYDADDES